MHAWLTLVIIYNTLQQGEAHKTIHNELLQVITFTIPLTANC